MGGLRMDQTELTLMDVETMRFWDYDILKANKPDRESKQNQEKYPASGWYEYATSNFFKVGDLLRFHYRSRPQMLHVRIVIRSARQDI